MFIVVIVYVMLFELRVGDSSKEYFRFLLIMWFDILSWFFIIFVFFIEKYLYDIFLKLLRYKCGFNFFYVGIKREKNRIYFFIVVFLDKIIDLNLELG